MLDPSVLQQLLDLQAADPDILAEIVALFGRDTPVRMSQLRAAATAGDAPAVGEVAHALKGSAASVGATSVAAACAQLEALARRGDVSGSERHLAVLDDEIPRVMEALRDAVQQPPSHPEPGR